VCCEARIHPGPRHSPSTRCAGTTGSARGVRGDDWRGNAQPRAERGTVAHSASLRRSKGVWEYVSKEEWKDVLTGAHKDELARVANYRGRMVILGKRTSKFGKGEFSDWLDWLNAAAVEDDVDLELEAA
jgi:hypothetical protein